MSLPGTLVSISKILWKIFLESQIGSKFWYRIFLIPLLMKIVKHFSPVEYIFLRNKCSETNKLLSFPLQQDPNVFVTNNYIFPESWKLTVKLQRKTNPFFIIWIRQKRF